MEYSKDVVRIYDVQVFKSRCTQISILWGLWKCDRAVPNDESDEEATATNEKENENNEQSMNS